LSYSVRTFKSLNSLFKTIALNSTFSIVLGVGEKREMAKPMGHTGVAHAHLSESALRALTKALKQTANDIKKNKPASCRHFLGYLKTRLKDSAIPDDCLTCNKILKCI